MTQVDRAACGRFATEALLKKVNTFKSVNLFSPTPTDCRYLRLFFVEAFASSAAWGASGMSGDADACAGLSLAGSVAGTTAVVSVAGPTVKATGSVAVGTVGAA
jgi:hypothetical protein